MENLREVQKSASRWIAGLPVFRGGAAGHNRQLAGRSRYRRAHAIAIAVTLAVLPALRPVTRGAAVNVAADLPPLVTGLRLFVSYGTNAAITNTFFVDLRPTSQTVTNFVTNLVSSVSNVISGQCVGWGGDLSDISTNNIRIVPVAPPSIRTVPVSLLLPSEGGTIDVSRDGLVWVERLKISPLGANLLVDQRVQPDYPMLLFRLHEAALPPSTP